MLVKACPPRPLNSLSPCPIKLLGTGGSESSCNTLGLSSLQIYTLQLKRPQVNNGF